MNIRQATPADGVEIQELLTRCGVAMAASGFSNWNPPPPFAATEAAIADGECYVGEADDRIVATVALLADGTIKRLAVDPSIQHGGVGRSMMSWIEARAISLGFAEIKLDALTTNTALISFYERLGYERASEHERDGWTFFRMKKLL